MGELLAAAAWAGKIYSGGWVDGGGPTFASVEPATGRQLAEVGSASTDDVRRAVQRATDAQQGWAATPYDRRASVLRRAADLLVEYQTELEDWVVREAGLPRYWAGALGAAEEFRQAAALASAPLGQVLPSAQPRLSLTRRRPVGVVGVIAPFNSPLMLAARAVAPALAVGNAVVLKPDPRTAVSGGVAFAYLLEQAGLPADVFHVLPGGADIGRELVIHPDVPVIAFEPRHLHLVAAPLVEKYTEQLVRQRRRRPGFRREASQPYGPLIDEAARDKVHTMVHEVSPCSSGCILNWVATPPSWSLRMPTSSRPFGPAASAPFTALVRCVWPQVARRPTRHRRQL